MRKRITEKKPKFYPEVTASNVQILYGALQYYENTIEKCIELLKVDGSNTKQQVRELLEQPIDYTGTLNEEPCYYGYDEEY